MPMLSVSEAHLAHRCPRLLAYLASGSKDAWKVGLSSTGSFPSKLFHNEVAHPFHQQACGAEKGPVFAALAELTAQPGRDLEKGLAAVLDRYILQPLLEKKGGLLRSDQIAALVMAVNSWGRVLSRFMAKCVDHKPGIGPDEVFCQTEETMQARISLPGGRTVLLKGRFDGLLLDPVEKEAAILEFKGFRPAHEDEDMIQVGLYALLLRRSLGVRPRGAVLYMEEKEIEAAYSADDLAGLEDNLLDLIAAAARVKAMAGQKGRVEVAGPADRNLCGQCLFNGTCDRDWGRRSGDRFEDESVDRETQGLLDSLVRTLGGIRLPVEPIGFLVGPRVIRLLVKPDVQKGATVSKIMNRANDLQIALSLGSAPYIHPGQGHLAVDVPRRKPEVVLLSRMWEQGRAGRPQSRAAFPLGMTMDGKVHWADLSLPTMTSILAAGTSGSGKSVFLRSAILGLARNSGPEEIRFTLIDPKLVTFGDIKNLPHLAGPLIFEVDEALKALEILVDEMEERYRVMAARQVIDIADYNQRHQPLTHHVVVIDEYADLMADREMKKQTEILVQRLCQKGRAAGFHLILSTQRPESHVVTPLIKANLQLKIALKVTSTANSKLILDESGAERLMGHGDMLVGGAVPLMRLQGPLSTRSDIEAAMGGGRSVPSN
jgi:S-DNA-T family DNA segregation ATPase FtsK/SpoIIIE